MPRTIPYVPISPSETSKSSPTPPKAIRKRTTSAKTSSRKSSERGEPLLACLNCRQKKVKCQPSADGCSRCLKLGLQCVEPDADERKRPSSKSHIRQLCERISRLEEENRELRQGRTPSTDGTQDTSVSRDSRPSPEAVTIKSDPDCERRNPQPRAVSRSDSLIAQLCGGVQPQLNRDEGGQMHFYGPTSSLHLTEPRSSSLLQWGPISGVGEQGLHEVAPELHAYLLTLYWTYQHPVLQVVHKEAFLRGMESGQTRYFSQLLLCCIYACAARISERPDIRALALPTDEDVEDEQPYFVKKATELLVHELKRPQITTIQALQLLSVIDCARSNDTKGWLFAGDACRLAFDLGLHRDCSELESVNDLTPMDLEARSVTFWGCFIFDRLWAMYLGRPHCIKLDDVTVPRPSAFVNAASSLDMKLAAAWADLLEIVGHICDALNGNHLTPERSEALHKRLLEWNSDLDNALRVHGQTTSAVYVLHLQYYSALILLCRPSAGFGTPGPPERDDKTSDLTSRSRATCVKSAMQMGDLLEGYKKQHGDATTMSGVGLHPISTAATVLIAEIVDRKKMSSTVLKYGSTTQQHFRCLKRCIMTLAELEKTYLVAKRVRKIIRMLMRLCNLGDGHPPTQSTNSRNTPSVNPRHPAPLPVVQEVPEDMQHQQQYHHDPQSKYPPGDGMDTTMALAPATHHSHPAMDLNFLTWNEGTSLPHPSTWDTSWGAQDLFSLDEAISTTSQMDILFSLESFFGNGYGG